MFSLLVHPLDIQTTNPPTQQAPTPELRNSDVKKAKMNNDTAET